MPGTWPAGLRHLLVPLDGSWLAESALPPAAGFADRFGARVTALHVLEPHGPAAIHGDRHLRGRGEAEAYLAGIREWFAERGIAVDAALREARDDDVAATIAGAAVELGADLVILAAHGSRGVRGLLYGRIGQQVLAHAAMPVLLVPASARARRGAFDCRRLMLPLDGSAAAEQALPAAVAVARAFDARVLLARVVQTPGALIGALADDRAPAARLMPTAAAAMLELEEQEAARYLVAVQARLEADGVAAETAVARGDPADVVPQLVAESRVDLLVLPTHGRAGAAAVWAGSVAARTIERSEKPMLLVKVE